MKKIILSLLIICLSTSLFANNKNNFKNVNFGIGICEQFLSQYDYYIDIYGPCLTINTENPVKFFNCLSTVSQTYILLPEIYIANLEDCNNVDSKTIPYFSNPIFVESLIGFKISKQILDEYNFYLKLGATLNYYKVNMYETDFNNINLGSFIGLGYKYLLDDKMYLSFDFNHVNYRYNLCFLSQNSHSTHLPDKNFEGDAFYINFSITQRI